MDKEYIRENFDLLSLVERDVSHLHRAGNNWIGHCPFCGDGNDRFTVASTTKGYRWALRKCEHGQNGSSWWDPIKYVEIREGITFVAASKLMAQWMGGKLTSQREKLKKRISPPPAMDLPSEHWQNENWDLIKISAQNLVHFRKTANGTTPSNPPRYFGHPEYPEKGELCRDYLRSRGIQENLWCSHLLGFNYAYDPEVKRRRPALVIPHFDSAMNLLAIKFRFIDHDPDGLRYISRKGSKLYFYGLEGIKDNQKTMLIIEGELNRLSVLQVLEDPSVAVISPGAENINPAQKALLPIITRSFLRVIIWMDDPGKAIELQSIVGKQRCKNDDIFQAPNGQDANDLLRAGIMPAFLQRIGLEIRS